MDRLLQECNVTVKVKDLESALRLEKTKFLQKMIATHQNSKSSFKAFCVGGNMDKLKLLQLESESVRILCEYGTFPTLIKPQI